MYACTTAVRKMLYCHHFEETEKAIGFAVIAVIIGGISIEGGGELPASLTKLIVQYLLVFEC